MRSRKSIRAALPALVVMLAIVGCGPTPPQAPLPQAKKLDSATSGISAACGEAYQVTAFPGDHRRDLAGLEAAASGNARTLSGVYHRNPAWIYQGETVAKIVDAGLSYLRSCGLNGASGLLARLTAHDPAQR